MPHNKKTNKKTAALQKTSFAAALFTGHVHHPAVAVLHDVARLAVDPAGRHAVHLEKTRLQGLGLALSPWRRQVGQLQGGTGGGASVQR